MNSFGTLRGLARARGRILKKRYGHKLSVVSLVLAAWLAHWMGEGFGAAAAGASEFAVLESALPGRLLALSLGFVFLGILAVRHQLYQASEIVILLAHPVAARAFVLWRMVEAFIFQLLLFSLGAFFLWGMRTGAKADWSSLGLLLFVVSWASWAVALEFLFAPLLQAMRSSKSKAVRGLLLLFALASLGAVVFGFRSFSRWDGFRGVLPWLPGGAPSLVVFDPSLVNCLSAVFGGLVACSLAFFVARRNFDELRGRAVSGGGRPGRSVLFAAWLTAIFPAGIRALLRRDLLLLMRGAFPRGALVLVGLWGLPLFFAGVSGDKGMEPWAFELMTLMVFVVLLAALSFLAGGDFPRHRRKELVFERALPIKGRTALWSRVVLAFMLFLPYALAIIAVVALHERAVLRDLTGPLVLKGVLLAACLCHQGALLGLRAENDKTGAEGLGFPLVIGAMGMGLALVARIFWPLMLLYPFFQKSPELYAARLYERGEVG